MSVFALIDANNFFASCERVFSPSLNKKPIVVLSNNDGCIIARSNESKNLGIPMGVPYYQWRIHCQKNKVHVFSSNFELYGDLSTRLMSLLSGFCPSLEVYSIDEAFLMFHEKQFADLMLSLLALRSHVLQCLGLPVCIGIASTKTLAKIANHIAKKKTLNGVFDLRDPAVQENVLEEFPIEDIWGIGRQLSKKLKAKAIHTAKQLRDSNISSMRRQFGVVMERIIQELRGSSCLPLETIQPRKQIRYSRSF
jgi:DNA polymerase V